MDTLSLLAFIKEFNEQNEKSLQGVISNKLSKFLRINSKEYREFTNKEDFLKNSINSCNEMFTFPIWKNFGFDEFVINILYDKQKLITRYKHQLKLAFENPEESYLERKNQAEINYLIYRKEIDDRN